MTEAERIANSYKTFLVSKGINTSLILSHFFAQLRAESELKPSRENMYYTTIKAARNAFYSPFKNKPDSFVLKYLRNPEKMGNYVYSNRMGNGPESSGDGYKFRGGGYLHHTGKAEMMVLKARTGVDFVSDPNLLLNETNAIVAAVDYWNRLGLSYYASKDNLDAISDLINIGRLTATVGDANGYEKRKEYLNYYKKIFKNFKF